MPVRRKGSNPRTSKPREEPVVIVSTEDGLIDFMPEKTYKKIKKAEKKAARKRYNETRLHTINNLTVIAIINLIPLAYFSSGLGENGIFLVPVYIGLALYVYWIEDRE